MQNPTINFSTPMFAWTQYPHRHYGETQQCIKKLQTTVADNVNIDFPWLRAVARDRIVDIAKTEISSILLEEFHRIYEENPANFLDLPPELRNKIYEYCSIIHSDASSGEPVPIAVHGRRLEAYLADIGGRHKAERRAVMQHPITRVCRQMRADTLPIFYGANRFVVYLYGPLDEHQLRLLPARWLRALTLSEIKMIPDVEFYHHTWKGGSWEMSNPAVSRLLRRLFCLDEEKVRHLIGLEQEQKAGGDVFAHDGALGWLWLL